MKNIREASKEEVRSAFSGRETELVLLFDIEAYYDWDDNECSETGVKVVTVKEAVEEFLSRGPYILLFCDGVYYGCGYGAYDESYKAIIPLAHGARIYDCDIRKICDEWEKQYEN